MADQNGSSNNNNSPKGWGDPRLWIALVVMLASITGVLILAWKVLAQDATDKQTYQYVFSTIIPLFGTWIGTVLAFYFSRENFESASRSVQDIVTKLTPMEKLKSISVQLKMIPKSQMVVLKLSPDKPGPEKITLIGDILAKLSEKNRLPVLDQDDKPLYMIHRSIIDKYIAQKGIEGLTSDQLQALTLQDILSKDADAKRLFETSFAVINENANLADAKSVMDSTPDCSDVFVTKNGTKYEPVTGWLTNLIITENAKV